MLLHVALVHSFSLLCNFRMYKLIMKKFAKSRPRVSKLQHVKCFILMLWCTISLYIVNGFFYETKANLSACGKLYSPQILKMCTTYHFKEKCVSSWFNVLRKKWVVFSFILLQIIQWWIFCTCVWVNIFIGFPGV